MAKKTQNKKTERSPAKRRSAGVKGATSLVIVESPAKAKTINKYLGSDYVVKASKGHVRDLPPHEYGVDPGANFAPNYVVLPNHKKVLDELRTLADKAEKVFLATDMDREGEAIAWHLMQALELPLGKTQRVVFNEITKSAIRDAFADAHEVNMSKVDAQQARRILDRIVGYELSPLLWKKIAKGLSAGRVQSVAVRLIVNREDEIRAFEPQESWLIDGMFSSDPGQAAVLAKQWRAFLDDDSIDGPRTQKAQQGWLCEHGCFQTTLVEVGGKPFKLLGRLDRKKPVPEMFLSAVDEARPLAEALGYAVDDVKRTGWEDYAHLGLQRIELSGHTVVPGGPDFAVKSIDTKRTRSKPPGPFTTATLQQAASNQLRLSASRTMRVAQGLYEGIDIKTGEGSVGLITYMRTDSVNLSKESLGAVRGWLADSFGEKYLPSKPNLYASSKKAQEAHEAIRPTDVTRTPEDMKGHMTAEQHKVYSLIWKRFVACQMTPAEWDATSVFISATTTQGEAVFKATGRVLVFDGFYKIAGQPKSGDDQTLPALAVNQPVSPLEIRPMQKFTSPLSRFTEASLVKTLEAEGIGRPSTYAAIIKTIQDRGYVEQQDRKFQPTSRGEVVTEKLVAHFPKIMDIRFTRQVEDELDKIEEKQLDWHHVLHDFYEPFKESLIRANDEMERVRAEPSEYVCDQCGKQMVYRMGRNGRFLSCSGYPECKVAKNIDKDGKPIEPIKGSAPCEKCGSEMIVRKGPSGAFLGCSSYPDCNNTMPCNEDGVPLKKVRAEDIKVSCVECGSAMEVKFARGRSFLGCSTYPKCKATTPMPEGVYVEKPKPEDAGVRCDKCGRAVVIRKSRRGPFLSCSGFPRCRNAMPLDKLEHLKTLEAEGKIPDAPTEPVNGNGKATRGKTRPKNLTKEEIAELGPPPAGFAWTRTGRPVVEVLPEKALTCFECGEEMMLRSGRFGPFFSCHSTKCKAIANLRGEAKKQAEAKENETRPQSIETDIDCPDCGKKMILKMGRAGRFLGCTGYPDCKKTMEPPPGLLREIASTAKASA